MHLRNGNFQGQRVLANQVPTNMEAVTAYGNLGGSFTAFPTFGIDLSAENAELCYGKIYGFFRVFVRNIFSRKLFTFNHFQFIRVHSSSSILVNQKMYKNYSSFWNIFCSLLAFIIQLHVGTFVHH